MTRKSKKPTIAIWKFASCDGCQLSLLDCEDELLDVAAAVDIAYFPEATSRIEGGPYDVSFVEGAITTPDDEERIHDVRRRSAILVTIGACATAGGIQALRNWADVDHFLAQVYPGARDIEALRTSTPVSNHVRVDFELRGCPVNKRQLLEVVSALLSGRKPAIAPHSVCLECKQRGTICVAVAHGTPCLGPVTHAGCGAICPQYLRGCYGCFGPMETPNTMSLAQQMGALGAHPPTSSGRSGASTRGRTRSAGRARLMKDNAVSRTIRVDCLTRVEGEGAVHVRIRDGRVAEAQLRIFEPPRFFEAFLRGRSHAEAPDITARICGICPVAYQISSVQAMENAFGTVVAPGVRALRRLLYCGEWIESHALHVAMLHAPDFLGYAGAVEMSADHPDLVRRALALKKAGNAVVALLGGREIHPVNVRIGGFYRTPSRSALSTLEPRLEEALDIALELVRWTATLPIPEHEDDYEFVALSSPDEYAICEGRIRSTRGLDIAPHEYEEHFAESRVAHSHALHSLCEGRPYVVGPLARFNLNFERLPERARTAAVEAGLQPPIRNPFRSIVVRAVEIVFAVEEALRIIRTADIASAATEPIEVREAVGHGCSEAPRGLLYHRYHVDGRGVIADAKIVPPTSQNQKSIEHDLVRVVEENLALDLGALTARCETAVRNYDPCISCATHFLRLTVERS